MKLGDVVSGRYLLEGVGGEGGMSKVFRAADRATGRQVAVKSLRAGHPDERFAREIAVLTQLSHPSIVRFESHGASEAGEPYIVMEWLDGVDLGEYLRRRRPSPGQALSIVRQVAEALAVAHAHGIVHRDIKPGNIFLVGGDPERVRLLDFGVAWLDQGSFLTQTGNIVGTPGYMSPEQARGERTVTAAADVFALGCVLYECLTGEPAFAGGRFAWVLAKILFKVGPRVSWAWPDVPDSIEALVDRMLDKDPAGRPAGGAAVVAELAPIALEVSGDREVRRDRQLLTLTERRLVSLILLERPRAADRATAEAGQPPESLAVGREARSCGGLPEELADGSMAIAFSGPLVATDLAARAAGCALALRRDLPGWAITISTFLAEPGFIPRSGEQHLLRGHAAQAAETTPIQIDEVTARLLAGRFDIASGAGGRSDLSDFQRAPGKRGPRPGPALSPFVGRDRELEQLLGRVDDCRRGEGARVLIVTSPAGFGKSRLAHELLQRVRLLVPAVAVWTACGDWSRAGVAHGVLSALLHDAVGVAPGEPAVARRARLDPWLAERVTPETAWVVPFVAELAGAPWPDDEAGPALRAARRDGRLMAQQLRRAWIAVGRAELARRALLLVVDDLQWCDLASMRLIDTLLQESEGERLMVLGLGRPDGQERFGQLWRGHGREEIELRELSGAACERLAAALLGSQAPREAHERVLRLARGHAFFLEELIHSVADHGATPLPETVIAMVESRLDALEPQARRILRAASVFGETFWEDAVMKLVGGEPIGPWLDVLLDRNLVVEHAHSRFPHARELAFRHALLREGAYASLTDDDRRKGHQLAGQWLGDAGEPEAILLAEHFERGVDRAPAADHFLTAAGSAEVAFDFDAAIDRARRGLACAPSEPTRLGLEARLALILATSNRLDEALPHAAAVLRSAPSGTGPWLEALTVKLAWAHYWGSTDEVIAALALVRDTVPAPDAEAETALVHNGAVLAHLFRWRARGAAALLERLAAHLRAGATRDPRAEGQREFGSCLYALGVSEDPWAARAAAARARANTAELGDQVQIALADILHGIVSWQLGAAREAASVLRAQSRWGLQLGIASSLRDVALCHALVELGDLTAAAEEAARMVGEGRAYNLPPYEGVGHWASATVLLERGDLDGAEREAAAALPLLDRSRPDLVAATALLSAIALARGATDAALAHGRAAAALLEEHGTVGHRGAFVRRAAAEAQHRAGDLAGARLTIRAARNLLCSRAEVIDDDATRRRFLGVPDHLRVLALAEAWG